MPSRRLVVFGLCSGLLAACAPATPGGAPSPAPVTVQLSPQLIPQPASLTLAGGAPFVLTDSVIVVAQPANPEVLRVAEMLASVLRSSTGFKVPVSSAISNHSPILLRLSADSALGSEGYQLIVTHDSVRITANAAAGLFHGVQTLRQLFPPQIESHMTLSNVAWTAPQVTIVDRPRYSWRGAMLDVARHFFTVDEVKQYIDLLAYYKMSVLHLHLADDQGWRIEIKSRPRLTGAGSGTEVGGGPGGYFTQADYTELARYAAERYVTIVPEIDMPGHSNAALIGYPELSCSIRAPAPYMGTDVGWSTFCANKEETYALVDDVVREIAAITPGPYFHMGGDENPILTRDEYSRFVERTQDIVARHGKQMVGWEEISHAPLKPTTIAEAWRTDTVAAAAVKYGAKVILAPGNRTYLDMKYDDNTPLGQNWAGVIEVRRSYDWDPATYMKGVTEANIAGLEAPIWSETLRNITAVEYMAMPRLPALAEVAWTPQSLRGWDAFKTRLAAHAARWNILGVNYYRSPQIPW